MKINDFKKIKKSNTKISVITCYDYTFAKIVAESNIDVVLVGDSGSMVMHGYPSTIYSSVERMVAMVESVAKGCPNKFIVADMSFLSYRKGLKATMEVIDTFMKAGAHSIKIEGFDGNEKAIKHIVQSGIPVMGHLGLTPHLINKFGGYFIKGKTKEEAEKILMDAKKLESFGCYSIILECVPSNLAKTITGNISIPTIGIGAGTHTDGQVLVLHDMLGLYQMKTKFVRRYIDGYNLIKSALNQYDSDVKTKNFPSEKESFSDNENF